MWNLIKWKIASADCLNETNCRTCMFGWIQFFSYFNVLVFENFQIVS